VCSWLVHYCGVQNYVEELLRVRESQLADVQTQHGRVSESLQVVETERKKEQVELEKIVMELQSQLLVFTHSLSFTFLLSSFTFSVMLRLLFDVSVYLYPTQQSLLTVSVASLFPCPLSPDFWVLNLNSSKTVKATDLKFGMHVLNNVVEICVLTIAFWFCYVFAM